MSVPPDLLGFRLNELTDEHRAFNDPDAVDTDAILQFIRRRWQLFLRWTFAGIVAGVAFAVLSPSYYTAYTTVLLEDNSWAPHGDLGNAAPAFDPSTAVYSQMQVLQSDEVLGPVIDQYRLTQDAEFGKSTSVLFALVTGQTRATPRHTTMIRVKKALSISRLATSNAVEVGFTSANPLRAATIVNAIAQSYIDGEIKRKLKAREDTLAELRKRLVEFRDKAFTIARPEQASTPATPESREEIRARFQEMQDNAETYRTLYNSFLQRESLNSGPQSVSPGARVITPAEPPLERSWPRAILTLAFAAAAGGAIGVGHALLRQATDHSVVTVQDVQQTTHFDRVAGVPNVAWNGWKADKPRHRGLQPAYALTSDSVYAAMSKLVVRLQAGQDHQRGRIIGVVAPSPCAGTSTIAAHLAKIIAKNGQKTLLIDANWDKPSLASMPDLSPSETLSNALTTIQLEPGSVDVLALSVMAPMSELNACLSIKTALQHYQNERSYNYVVVDFRSVEQTADLEGSLSFTDEVIVVAQARKTSAESLRSILRLIPRNKVAAVILNKI